jgi:alpha-L-rhamnosidase
LTPRSFALGETLRKINAVEDFYKILLQTGIPSWLYQVINGGMTTWERWDSMLANGTVDGCGITSFIHYAFGSVVDWMHKSIGGLAPLSPGWREIQIAPVPGGNTTSTEIHLISSPGAMAKLRCNGGLSTIWARPRLGMVFI